MALERVFPAFLLSICCPSPPSACAADAACTTGPDGDGVPAIEDCDDNFKGDVHYD